MSAFSTASRLAALMSIACFGLAGCASVPEANMPDANVRCENVPSPTAEFTAIEKDFASYVNSEIAYMNSRAAKSDILIRLEKIRHAARAAIEPLEHAFNAGHTPDSTALDKARLAVNALGGALAIEGISITGR
jgi:hypothetical protein